MKKLIIILLVLFSISSYAQKQRETYEVHAMMIFNFIKYIEFTMPDANANFNIGVLSDDDTYKTMENWYDGKIYKGAHVIKVRRLKTAADISNDLNLVFITPDDSDKHSAVYNRLKGTNIMLLSAGEELSGKGSVINLVIVNGKLNFEISKKEAASHNIKISSQLLALSKEVD